MSAQHVLHTPHDLRDLVLHTLEQSTFVRGGRFDVVVEEDEVRITGRVRTWFEKQMAQEQVRRLAGVRRVWNDLAVTPA